MCRPQVVFARGGVEIFTDDLVAELRARGHDADLVSVPFKWYPGERVLTQAFLWRLLDLDEADGRRVELVIATKFPSYVVRHPNKVVWLVHQFRQAYDFDRGEYRAFSEKPLDRATPRTSTSGSARSCSRRSTTRSSPRRERRRSSRFRDNRVSHA